MITKNDLLTRAEEKAQRYGDPSIAIPIFEILVFEHPDQQVMYGDKPSGWPDLGASRTMGFYHDLDDAIESLNWNNLDIQERLYHAAFILMKLPGLYNEASRFERMYFLWDENRGGFFQAEEPKLFRGFMY